ncbi:MAG: non-canonical purine NTP pyrophosphatase [Desulfuromonas sp.]|nr:MAG: non-canonical purine NTP pyrophosphatase [Desulfuromonas sp.]
MKLLIATANRGKLREIEHLLEGTPIEIVGLDQLENPPEVVEDGDTFTANARKKATEMARFSGLLTLADDSGLVVDALDGAPGVYSARYAGCQGDDEANNVKLLKELDQVPEGQRQGAFHCVMALAWPDGRCEAFEGKIAGLILRSARGEGGFGYDPLFLVPEYGKTTAELPLAIKNRISHRGTALRQVIPVLKRLAADEA